MKKDIYIFRHGETEWNSLRKLQGIQDIPLNEKGIQQAGNIHKYLLNKDIKKIYSSPLCRAIKTAEIVAETINAEIILEENLREIYGGTLEGTLKKDVDKELINKWKSNDPIYDTISYPGGESKIDARNRIVNAVGNIAVASTEEVLCFSSHYGPIKQLTMVSGVEDTVSIKNCEITYFKFDTEKFATAKNLENKVKAFEFIERIDTQI